MVTEAQLCGTDLLGKGVQNATPQAAAEAAVGLSRLRLVDDDAVGVLRDDAIRTPELLPPIF